MYRMVIANVECPASSWIAFGAAPRIARCEQNVCRSTSEGTAVRLAEDELATEMTVRLQSRLEPIGQWDLSVAPTLRRSHNPAPR